MMSIWLIFAFSYDRIALPPQKFTNLTKCVLKLPFLEVGQQSVQDPDPWEKIKSEVSTASSWLSAWFIFWITAHEGVSQIETAASLRRRQIRSIASEDRVPGRQLCQERALRSCTGPPMSFYSSGSGWKLSYVFETNLPQDHLEGVFQISNQRMPRAETANLLNNPRFQ